MRGRPKKETTRDIVLKIRLTTEENEMLEEISRYTNKTKSEVVRKALLEYFEYFSD